MEMRDRTYRLWGGFCGGKLCFYEIDDLFGGSHKRLSPALFRTRREARKQFQDVRPVEVQASEGP